MQTNCAVGDVVLSLKYEEAQTVCHREGDTAFRLTVRPEAEPINPSPWYAFTVETRSPATVTVTLDYGTYKHRYRPKKQIAPGVWQPLPLGRTQIMQEGTQAQLTLALSTGQHHFAAQEMLGVTDRADWVKAYTVRHGLILREIGKSVEGRPIYGFTIGSPQPGANLVLILGGQHPPEVPGTLGLYAFLDALYAQPSTLERVLDRHVFLVVPDLNPDGVAGGHWRLNAGLIDLNRDWGPFTQPETQAVRAEMDALLTKGLKPKLLLDFHATRRTVFYTPPEGLTLKPATLVSDWIGALTEAWPGDGPDESSNHNPDLPTAKVWFAETYGAPGVTVEFSDTFDREALQAFSKLAAETLLDLFITATEGDRP